MEHAAVASPRSGNEPSLATEVALVQEYLAQSIDSLAGARPIHWSTPFARKWDLVALTDTHVLIRDGWLAHKVHLVPRERIQNVNISRGPLERRWGLASLNFQPGNDTFNIGGLREHEALALFETLVKDAGEGRRYREREKWAAPRLGQLHAEGAQR